MSSISVAGDTSGAITLQAPAVSGTNTLTLPASTDTLVGKATTDTLTNKTLTSPIIGGTPSGVGTLTSGTAVASTSGTSIDFTGIPSWAKRITVMFNGVSTNGTSFPQVQLGTSGGIETTGYTGTTAVVGHTGTGIVVQLSTGVLVDCYAAYYLATSTRQGSIVFNLLGSNTWTFSGSLGSVSSVLPAIAWTGGFKTTAGVLDRLRITTVNGTDTFDAGSINILYE